MPLDDETLVNSFNLHTTLLLGCTDFTQGFRHSISGFQPFNWMMMMMMVCLSLGLLSLISWSMFVSVLVYFHKYHGQCLSQSWFTFINIMVNVYLSLCLIQYITLFIRKV